MIDPKITVEDCVKAAFAAVLRGDYAEGDRLMALVNTTMNGRDKVPANEPVPFNGKVIDGECKRIN